MISEEEQRQRDIYDDFCKFGDKINAMMQVSTEGDCPQIYKMILMAKLTNIVIEQIKKDNFGIYNDCVQQVDEILADNAELKIIKKEHKSQLANAFIVIFGLIIDIKMLQNK